MVGLAQSTFLVLEGGLDEKLCPLIMFWTFAYLSWRLALSSLHVLLPSRGIFLISCWHTCMMVKVKWPSLSSYMTSFPCFTRMKDVLTNMLVFYLHTHFANPHIDGCATYWLTSCTHLRNFVILLKKLYVILIQNILTKNCYKNGRLHMHLLWIFGSASVIYSFKLRRSRWNLSIFGTDSSTALRNLLIPRRSLNSSLVQHSSMMELHNHRQTRSLSQVIVHRPLIKQLHHFRAWKILGVNIHRWVNFPWFFQKKIHQFPFFIKFIPPNFTI